MSSVDQENPGLATSDHEYSKIIQDIPSTSETDTIFLSSTPVKSAQCFSHTSESDELSPVKSITTKADPDLSFIPSDESTNELSNLSSDMYVNVPSLQTTV